MLKRCFAALIPRSNFLDVLDGNPDLYGPFWIATTVVVILFMTGTISGYLAQLGKGHYAYDFTLLSGKTSSPPPHLKTPSCSDHPDTDTSHRSRGADLRLHIHNPAGALHGVEMGRIGIRKPAGVRRAVRVREPDLDPRGAGFVVTADGAELCVCGHRVRRVCVFPVPKPVSSSSFFPQIIIIPVLSFTIRAGQKFPIKLLSNWEKQKTQLPRPLGHRSQDLQDPPRSSHRSTRGTSDRDQDPVLRARQPGRKK